MKNTTIRILWNTSLKQEDCNEQMMYMIKMNPFNQKSFRLKTYTSRQLNLIPGEYRISLQFFAKHHTIDVNVSINNTTIQESLTFGKFLYFKITPDFKVIPGNKKLFDYKFMLRRQNSNKEKRKFWNTYWKLLHTTAFHYPDNPTPSHRKDIIQLFKNIKNNGLPCQICSTHFKQYTIKNEIHQYLDNQETLFTYLFDLHNGVNKRNNKQIFSKEKAYKIYETTLNEIKEEFDVDIEELIKQHTVHTIPKLINGPIRTILKKQFNLI